MLIDVYLNLTPLTHLVCNKYIPSLIILSVEIAFRLSISAAGVGSFTIVSQLWQTSKNRLFSLQARLNKNYVYVIKLPFSALLKF